MATNYVGPGASLDITAGSGISSGDVVIQGNLIGIALADIANGAVGTIAIEGVYTVPKVTAAVVAQGQKVIWDSSTSKFDDDQLTPATGDITNGAVAMESATSSDTTIKVRLNPGNGVVA